MAVLPRSPIRRESAVRRSLALLPLGLALILFAALAAYQLGLPGLHYDEAREAGINAMQLVLHQPVQLFRGAGLRVGGLTLPLMVQDYIGALNVYLALPFLALGGIGVPQLRALPIVCGLLSLIFLYALARQVFNRRVAAAAVLLLAVNPSYVFWTRQGVLVTSVTLTILLASLWTAWRWRQASSAASRLRWLVLTGFLWGIGLWSKLLFVWGIGAVAGVTLLAWAWRGLHGRWALRSAREQGWAAVPAFLLAVLTGMAPLILFNLQTGGTLTTVLGNLNTSYYGVSNANFADNLLKRLRQVVILLQGNHLWYLGEVFANPLAVWALGVVLGAALLLWLEVYLPGSGPLMPDPGAETYPLPPLFTRAVSAPGGFARLAGLFVFNALIVVQSCFTVSSLFVTHYALLLPFLILLGAAAADLVARHGRLPALLALAALLAWGGADLGVTLRYHQTLSVSGGYAAHSDASYHLAYYLENNGYATPVALDWGIDAPLVYLSRGRVTPIEAFGYARLDAPDADFAQRLAPFLADPQSVYLLHTPEFTVFEGRRRALEQLASLAGRRLETLEVFRERSGRPLVELLRVVKP